MAQEMTFESHLHYKFNVAKHDSFYNKSIVTSTGFIYGFLGKKHNKESRKLAINKKIITMRKTDDNGESLYDKVGKKASLTKYNTILENGLNIHQTAVLKYKERLDIIRIILY